VNHGHRSTIKKILEGDAVPSSMMILCISNIHCSDIVESGTCFETRPGAQITEAVKIELTDGWCEFQLPQCLIAIYIYIYIYIYICVCVCVCVRVPEIHSDFPFQVFNECYFRCSIVKATCCWKIVCGTEAPSNVLSVFVVYLTFLDYATLIMLNSVYIYAALRSRIMRLEWASFTP